jgi:hypothetical protein
MDLAQQLLFVADTYAEHRRVSRTTVSGEIFRDSRVLDRIASGKSLTVRNYEKAMIWLSDRWPDETPWPGSALRPNAPTDKPDAA